MTRLRRRIAKETGEPIRTDKGGASRKLEELLQKAVQEEDYEKAVKLRDEISKR